MEMTIQGWRGNHTGMYTGGSSFRLCHTLCMYMYMYMYVIHPPVVTLEVSVCVATLLVFLFQLNSVWIPGWLRLHVASDGYRVSYSVCVFYWCGFSDSHRIGSCKCMCSVCVCVLTQAGLSDLSHTVCADPGPSLSSSLHSTGICWPRPGFLIYM